MRRTSIGLMVMVVASLLAATVSFAQRGPAMMWRGSGGWGPGTQYNRMYDTKTVETISGEVTTVDRITPAKGMAGGVHMNVKTDKRNDLGASGSELVPGKPGREDRSEG